MPSAPYQPVSLDALRGDHANGDAVVTSNGSATGTKTRAIGPHWGPDPYEVHALRFWDGSQWTDQTADSVGDFLSSGWS